MKKTTKKKLALNRETVQHLQAAALRQAAGGAVQTTGCGWVTTHCKSDFSDCCIWLSPRTLCPACPAGGP